VICISASSTTTAAARDIDVFDSQNADDLSVKAQCARGIPFWILEFGFRILALASPLLLTAIENQKSKNAEAPAALGH
jgi:hypothetical protein